MKKNENNFARATQGIKASPQGDECSANSLLTLPIELLVDIIRIALLLPSNLVDISLTCKIFYSIINGLKEDLPLMEDYRFKQINSKPVDYTRFSIEKILRLYEEPIAQLIGLFPLLTEQMALVTKYKIHVLGARECDQKQWEKPTHEIVASVALEHDKLIVISTLIEDNFKINKVLIDTLKWEFSKKDKFYQWEPQGKSVTCEFTTQRIYGATLSADTKQLIILHETGIKILSRDDGHFLVGPPDFTYQKSNLPTLTTVILATPYNDFFILNDSQLMTCEKQKITSHNMIETNLLDMKLTTDGKKVIILSKGNITIYNDISGEISIKSLQSLFQYPRARFLQVLPNDMIILGMNSTSWLREEKYSIEIRNLVNVNIVSHSIKRADPPLAAAATRNGTIYFVEGNDKVSTVYNVFKFFSPPPSKRLNSPVDEKKVIRIQI